MSSKNFKINSPKDSVPSNKLVLDQKEWNRIKRNIDKKPIIESKTSHDRIYEDYLRNGSRKMVQNWDNTIEKIRERKILEQKRKSDEEKSKGLI